MSKAKKMNMNLFEQVNHNDIIETISMSYSNDEVQVSVKSGLDFTEAATFVADVVQCCIDINEGRYSPELLDYAIRACTIVYYTNVSMPKDGKKAYNAVYRTSLYDNISGVIARHTQTADQWRALIKAACEKIDYYKTVILNNQKSQIDSIISSMNAMAQNNQDVISQLDNDDFKSAMSELVDMYQNIKQQSDEESHSNIIHIMPASQTDDIE